MLLSAPGILGRHRGLHMLLCQSRMAHGGRQCDLHAQPLCFQSLGATSWACGVATSRPHHVTHLCNSASTICSAARQAAFALHASSDVAEDVRRVIEQAERAASTWTTLETDFYTPAVVAEAQRALAPLSEVTLRLAEPRHWSNPVDASRSRAAKRVIAGAACSYIAPHGTLMQRCHAGGHGDMGRLPSGRALQTYSWEGGCSGGPRSRSSTGDLPLRPPL